MIAIDTNVLVRVLVDDPDAEKQCRTARNLVNSHGNIWISRVVLMETVWVLESVYKFKKDQIISVLEKINRHKHIHLEKSETYGNILTLFSASNTGFSDCLILNEAQSRQLILYTFDRKLSRLHGARHVEND